MPFHCSPHFHQLHQLTFHLSLISLSLPPFYVLCRATGCFYFCWPIAACYHYHYHYLHIFSKIFNFSLCLSVSLG